MRSAPTWQVDGCPRWCAVEHGEADHPDDRVHRSAPVAVPVIAHRTRFAAAGVSRSAESAEVDVALCRVHGERETWLYVGEGPASSLEVSAESAERLVVAITEALRSR